MRRRPSVEVRLSPAVVRPGDTLDVDLRLFSKAQTPVEGLRLTLRGEETGQYSAGKSTIVQRHPLVALTAVFEPVSLAPGEHRHRARFALPPTLPPTCTASPVQVAYTLRVEVDIPWWPDVDTQYTVVVAPHAVRPEAAPWVFRSHEGEVRDRALHAECSLGTTDVAPGGVLVGQLSLGNVRHHRVQGVELALVADARIAHAGRTFEAARYTFRIADTEPADGAPLPFRLRVPSDAPYAYDGAVTGLAWRLEASALHTLSRTRLLSIPLRVVALLGDAPDSALGVAVVGNLRRARVWARAAHHAGLHYDETTDTLRATIGPVSVTVATEDRPAVGARTFARLRWPALGLGLALRPARWADLFGTRHRLGDAAFDDALHLSGRDPAQLRALLTEGLRAQLVHFPEVSLDDDGGTLSVPGSGVDAVALQGLLARVLAVARAFAEADARIPPPAPLAPHVAAWRAYAARVQGRFEPGRVFVHNGQYGTARFSVGHRWRDADTPDATVLHLHADPGESDALLADAADLSRRSSAATALWTSLESDGARLTLSAEGLARESPGLTPDPLGLEDTLDRMVRLVRALRGLRDGAVFR